MQQIGKICLPAFDIQERALAIVEVPIVVLEASLVLRRAPPCNADSSVPVGRRPGPAGGRFHNRAA
eukprot:8246395-Lingulodinium_polyedra.AAC.1